MQIFLLFCTKKSTFFYFTHLILQNTHIGLSILHIYSIKYSFFYHFFIIFFTASLSLLYPTTIIITTWSANHSRSNQPKIRNPFKPKPIQSETQIITYPPTQLLDTPSFWDAKLDRSGMRRRYGKVGCKDVMARSLKDWDLRTRTESRTKEEADPTCLNVLFFQFSSFSVAGLMLIRRVLGAVVVWCWSQRVRWEGEWGESESNRDQEREKIVKILNAHATVTVHICTVTLAIVHFCTTFTPTDVGVFLLKMCKISYFFHFAQLYTYWWGCS